MHQLDTAKQKVNAVSDAVEALYASIPRFVTKITSQPLVTVSTPIEVSIVYIVYIV